MEEECQGENEPLTAIFKQMDYDNDGVISRSDLEEFYRVSGISASEESISKILGVAEHENGFKLVIITCHSKMSANIGLST